ncbi:ribonucleoside-diphosphate reductase subunit alpha [Coxiella endosymbiont of Amblyomma americanum]|uniref:ribonucleoside-diphosphate reductase subunit alpha n=1 Tax=Coxiella endosymbiont of Amblyomma americanum TaxID=325775 RepID=UPI00058010D1|nr:ribonucleoside-diphosphate reductase subunit alpha [Coxiella endosymbiont of Amblyomma americanum]AJC50237.1 ribonucleotide-diphosphate reductase subunit alpha [Coxiella endosymbiont of Amblyomma americanum]AUJ58597.1 ribonucleoside-diphosphate reductase subunit alpha [Coxiella-like endosymbiont of Amblyomma americanum]
MEINIKQNNQLSIGPLSTISSSKILNPLYVIKRNGNVVRYNINRVIVTMKKAFLTIEGEKTKKSNQAQKAITQLTNQITNLLHRRWSSSGAVHVESIRDQVELTLACAGLHKVARSYALHRKENHEKRERQKTHNNVRDRKKNICVTLEDGTSVPLDNLWLTRIVYLACNNLKDVDANKILLQTKNNLFDGITHRDIYRALVMTARTLVESEPNYTYVAARLLLHHLYNEALNGLDINHNLVYEEITEYYPTAFKAFIKKGIAEEHLDPKLNNFNLDKLAKTLQPQSDKKFTYLSIQTLYDRYLIHHHQTRIELPQVFFMRVAMGLAQSEKKEHTRRAIEFYKVLSSFDFMSSTPTLFNSGTLFPQLSSCFLTTIPDNLEGIYNAFKDNALLSKYAGGLGNDWSQVRAMGAHIKGTNGKSLGIVPFLNVADATAIAVNQGGKRKGAVCAYLETWHMDIEEFLDLRKNTGDDRRRTHDMNTANWIPDLFMKRVFENKFWTLFSPNEVPDLHDKFGFAFEKAYVSYENAVRKGKIHGRTVSAVVLWRKILSMLFETGHPWITFKDACNLRSPQQHVGVIHSSNLCTEITLNTSEKEIAVCNLGSINLVNHMKEGKLDIKKIRDTIKTAIRMLDNVIDINYYSVPQARKANLKHRPIGLGLMGFQDALYIQKVPYASKKAIQFSDYSMEVISYYAIKASMELAKERGVYETFKGSLWSRGVLPIDSIQLLKKNRGKYLKQNVQQTLNWDKLRQQVKIYGLRNSNVMAIAPTATISNICGISQSIEPTYQNLFVKSNLSGEFTIINPYLVASLKNHDLWDDTMVHDLKHYNGSIQQIHRIPQDLKRLYATAFEVESRWLIGAASRRQKWIDQAQSFNLYITEPSGKKLDTLYRMAWLHGLKTTYYLRSIGATGTEKATIRDATLNAVINQSTSHMCVIENIENTDCEACQ